MKKYAIIIPLILIALLFAGCNSTSISGQLVGKITNKPRVLTVDPKKSAENVALDAKIVIKFDRDMDQSSLNNRNISIKYKEDNLGYNVNPFLGSKFEYDKDFHTLTITPPQNFLPNKEIIVILREGIKDLQGENISLGEYEFRTASE